MTESHSGRILNEIKNFKIIDCKSCGFIHISPIPTNSELLELYQKEFFQHIKPNDIKKDESELDYWNITYDEKLKILEKHLNSNTKKILDIGCGAGFFLKRAMNNDWDTTGIEPSDEAADYANSLGIKVIKQFFQNLTSNDLETYDSIHMRLVLEHSSSPEEIIKKCYSLLNKNGILIVEVPNDYNPLQKIVKTVLQKDEYWLHPPIHINYFTFSSLRNLLEKNRFNVIHQDTTFPLELFLLMGNDYIQNESLGKQKHIERMNLEINLNKGNSDLKQELYSKLAELNLGRTIILYARKIN
ncbi:hypothetical protein NKOR_00490 [Candidatus Nitrosopumilus koreensis AR1]|uniref:Type 11 methyltransferase n=1 Tax=Candidatus Nitrosopumilus koreensis AR1 TaxID=1229908 RepID=K0B541_9ARCH|nr:MULTISPECIES: class I SAM-dependent methyltransferase [Nitrosopumilus]AFS80020.1 hypothetical protein NKOR_00490 [Candidatus Nitrosopumilus koreensis AR1]